MKNCFLISLLMILTTPAFGGQNVVVVVDDSGSMAAYMDNTTTRIEAAKMALKQTVANLPSDTRIGIITLNGYWEPDQWLVPFGRINKEEAFKQISQLEDSGGTPLGAAMKAGCDVLLADREKNGYGIYTLLVVTDGEAGDPYLVEAYVEDIKSRGITIDAIGVDMAQDHSLATKVHAYRRADDPKALMKAISETFAETNTSDQSAALEDFAILAGLPDGAASKIIDALAQGNNVPIGQKQEVVLDEDGQIQFDDQGQVVTAPPSSEFPWWGWILVIGGIFLCVALMVAFLPSLRF